MRRIAVLATGAGLALAMPAAAADQGPPRLASYVDVFASQAPGTSTARHAETDLTNPTHPDGKPPAVSHVHVDLAPGTVVDTNAVPRCTASDGELMARGSDACPPGSVVGSGMVDVDTGVDGPGRHVLNDIAFVNAPGELLFLITSRGSGARVVLHGKWSGSALDVDIPPLPGAPPDGGADTHEVIDLQERSSVRDGSRVAYLTTPPNCPESGRWTNRITYTFRDGVVQSFSTDSPCRAPDSPRPRVRIGGAPHHRCVRHSFRARVSVTSAARLSHVDVLVDGRRLRRTPARRFATRIPIGRFAHGRHRLTVVARDAAGGTATRNARFRRC